MLSELIPYLSTYEKELAILDVIKNAEKEKKHLSIAIYGSVDGWIYEWIAKRGHSISAAGRDLGIFVDFPMNEKRLKAAKKKFRSVAIICPSEDVKSLPAILNKKIDSKVILDEEEIRKKGGEVREIFYGFWNVFFFNLKETKFDRFEFSITVWLAALLMLIFLTSYPVDDLLRHVKVHEYNYDYGNIFAYSWNFSFNPYLLFDHFVGFLDKQFGKLGLKIIQVLCFLLFSLAFFLHTRNWNDRFRALIFVLILSIIGPRITSARPAIFEAFLFIIGLALTGLPAILLGILMGSFYYLFPIFLVPLISVRKEYAISLVICLLFWISYAGVNYFYDIYFFISSIITNREVVIGENITIISVLQEPAAIFLIFLFLKSKNFVYARPIIFFLLFNQLRFVDVLVPLVGISLVEESIAKNISIKWIRLGFLEHLFLLMILIASLGVVFHYYEIEHLDIENGKVLCGGMKCMFNTIYTGKNISISPSMEIGLTDREVQLQIKKIMDGSLDCEFFEKYDYDFLVEDSLKEVPECLSLLDVEKGYRIWKIKK